MYTISEIARLTGISAYTLRYYEKIGVLPDPTRQEGRKNGIRRYSDQDLRFIRFIHGLKQTGMKLEEIAAFVQEGCLLADDYPVMHVDETLKKRIEILDVHLEHLEKQMQQLEAVRNFTLEKRAFYVSLQAQRGPIK
ncbi:MerR family transcriptional regulator [Brevibacillus nitrificans]|uniref:MerR family transcriptional regulator n=1 Tax=Brevibacillus nitrificans TaxID=651560 RepID=UPI00285D5B07|nr:MerR family transcriptional regulator [Brevibacillus nitrificans]MDR7316335.1 DNA-binding transcriptional MerR regulator [Brevibacillus nitrificans]